jgi:hypothetical protein
MLRGAHPRRESAPSAASCAVGSLPDRPEGRRFLAAAAQRIRTGGVLQSRGAS